VFVFVVFVYVYRQSVIDQDQHVARMPSLLALFIISNCKEFKCEVPSATQEMRHFPVCRLLDKHWSRQGSSLYAWFLLIDCFDTSVSL
jgi:hypothetical protein